jgi:ribosomal protein L12E/L44/L45/RPP1/RPP2
MKEFILERGKESSTWRGLVAIITAAGITLDPAQMEAIVAAGLAAIGVIGAFFPDKK